MWVDLIVSSSSYAKRWLIWAVLVQITLFGIALLDPALGWFGGYGSWTNREAMVLASMLLLLAGAWAMHKHDQPAHGWGFRHVYLHTEASHEPDDQKYVPATLTVESIRAAMIVGILAALFTEREHYLPAGQAPHGLPLWSLTGEPGAVFFLLVTGALGSALVTTMAALLCYEYATRFAWKIDGPKVELHKKAFHLGKLGFYCLMWSLAIIPVLLDYHLGFISILFVFIVMWLYYFFPAQQLPSATSDSPAP